MTVAELIEKIEAIDTSDPEAAHDELDELLLDYAGPEVRAAVRALQNRCAWWASA